MAEGRVRARRRKTPEDWADAALAAIAEGGLAAVAVEPLAVRLGTTKGSFYWHFANREALLEAALALWEERTTTAILREVEQAFLDPADRFRLLVIRVVDLAEKDPIGPALASSAGHPLVGPVLSRVTRTRVDAVVSLFTELGFSPDEARSRALLAYSAYLGHSLLVHSTPEVLPEGGDPRRAYLDHVLRTLTTP
jgi:AcrR family transcriptional regulator